MNKTQKVIAEIVVWLMLVTMAATLWLYFRMPAGSGDKPTAEVKKEPPGPTIIYADPKSYGPKECVVIESARLEKSIYGSGTLRTLIAIKCAQDRGYYEARYSVMDKDNVVINEGILWNSLTAKPGARYEDEQFISSDIMPRVASIAIHGEMPRY